MDARPPMPTGTGLLATAIRYLDEELHAGQIGRSPGVGYIRGPEGTRLKIEIQPKTPMIPANNATVLWD